MENNYIEKFQSFDRETERLLLDNSNGENNDALRQRMRTRAIMTYDHNLGYYYKKNPFGNELFFIDSWIEENKNWLEITKVSIYYGASEVRSNENYTQFTIKINGEQKIVGRVEDYYITLSCGDDYKSLKLRKNYFQELAYVEYLKERRLELTQPKQPEPEPIDLSVITPSEKEIIVIKEPYSEMFSNDGFKLFEHILSEYVKPIGKKGRKSDLIYFYWEMYNNKPQFIHQRPTPFFEWYENKYIETTGQLKTYNNVKTDQRIKDYSTALEWFKLKEK